MTTNVNGTARNNNNTRLDGAQSVNIWLPHHSAYVPPSESVQEVNISTNNFEAEQGLAGGAAVQVITKSGGNQFHGSAFVYHDNHFFRAKNAFYPTTVAGAPNPNKPKNLRTIPGATVGGPIMKDKLFFFGSWEGMYERVIGDGFFTVPTPELRIGNFSGTNTTIYDPLTGNLDGTGRTAFGGRNHPAIANPSGIGQDARSGSAAEPEGCQWQLSWQSTTTMLLSQVCLTVTITTSRSISPGLTAIRYGSNSAIWVPSVTGNYALGPAGGTTLGSQVAAVPAQPNPTSELPVIRGRLATTSLSTETSR